MGLLNRKKDLTFERTYAAPIDVVWQAWTDPSHLRHWWGPEHTSVPTCEVDLRVGGQLLIVMEATEGMGTYAGTRWPMAGTFTRVEPDARITYDARSWTEGDEATTTITHVNDVTMRATARGTEVRLHVAITNIGPKAKMAAFGMKWGYEAQLDKLEQLLTA